MIKCIVRRMTLGNHFWDLFLHMKIRGIIRPLDILTHCPIRFCFLVVVEEPLQFFDCGLLARLYFSMQKSVL
jgi:hypothetical protein